LPRLALKAWSRVLSQSFTRFQYYFESAIFLLKNHRQEPSNMSIDFKGSQYPKDVILHAVFFYVRYAVSYRDLEEIMAERGVQIDQATLNRWVVKYSPDIAKAAQTKKQATAIYWRMDETYIKVRGKWT
jgi:putative transposase